MSGWDFPGGPEVKTLSSQCRGHNSIPGQGSHMCLGQRKKKKLYAKIYPEHFIAIKSLNSDTNFMRYYYEVIKYINL